MPLLLRPTIHLARLGDELVMLDVESDRYRFLDADQSARLLHADSAPASPVPFWFAPYSNETGLGVAEAIRRTEALASLGVTELISDGVRAPWATVLRAALLIRRTSLTIRYTSLSRTLSDLERRRERAQSSTPVLNPPALSIVAAHRQAAILSGHGTSCLPRSIALVRHLTAHGIDASLVIGIKLRPFAAHAWVRSGDQLLNDSLESVRRFSPIIDL